MPKEKKKIGRLGWEDYVIEDIRRMEIELK